MQTHATSTLLFKREAQKEKRAERAHLVAKWFETLLVLSARDPRVGSEGRGWGDGWTDG